MSSKISIIEPDKTKAIFLGISEYDSFNAIKPIKNNIRKLNELFQDSRIIGLKKENILLIDEKKSHGKIIENIRKFVGSEDFIDTIIFYFAGHGQNIENEYHLLTSNSQSELLNITSIPWMTLKSIFEKGNGIQQRLYILDACYSGSAMGKKDLNYDVASGSAIIASAIANEEAYFKVENEYTDFTNVFIDILEKGIEFSKESISIDSIYDYLKKKINIPKPKTTETIKNIHFFKNVSYDKNLEIVKQKINSARTLMSLKDFDSALTIIEEAKLIVNPKDEVNTKQISKILKECIFFKENTDYSLKKFINFHIENKYLKKEIELLKEAKDYLQENERLKKTNNNLQSNNNELQKENVLLKETNNKELIANLQEKIIELKNLSALDKTSVTKIDTKARMDIINKIDNKMGDVVDTAIYKTISNEFLDKGKQTIINLVSLLNFKNNDFTEFNDRKENHKIDASKDRSLILLEKIDKKVVTDLNTDNHLETLKNIYNVLSDFIKYGELI